VSPVRRAESWTIVPRGDATVASPDAEHVYSFDLEGRPLSWFERGRLYKRSLSSEVVGRERDCGERARWRVPEAEAREIFGRILARVAEAPADPLGREARDRLDRILSWSPERLIAERSRFERAYRPIAILPPDAYLSIVVQATFGCSWNRCTFCSFYQDRPFRARTPGELDDHLAAVDDLLGRGAVLRRSIFLADGNALILSNDRLREMLSASRRRFEGRPVDAFVDVFGGERKSPAEWEELRALGLRRVHVGLETGHDPLLRWMNKPGSAEEALEVATAVHRAGLALSVIVMVGAGGDRFAAAHESDTLALLSRLPLGRGDIVYLSPFVEHDGSEYARLAAAEEIAPLEPSDLQAAYGRFREAVREMHPSSKVTRYDIREFVY